jgi:hypothetical protein
MTFFYLAFILLNFSIMSAKKRLKKMLRKQQLKEVKFYKKLNHQEQDF